MQAARAGTPSLFRGGSRASVTVDLCPVNLSELVRTRRGIVALNAYAVGGASAKREQSATESTPAGHASDDAVAFRGGAGELQLKPCLPIGAALQRNPSLLATPIVCLPGRHYPALVLISAKPSFDFCLNVFETSRKGEMKYSFLARRIAVNVP